MRQDKDRLATQDFSVFTTLVEYTGKVLTPEVIDEIRAKLKYEMRNGPSAWAFKK